MVYVGNSVETYHISRTGHFGCVEIRISAPGNLEGLCRDRQRFEGPIALDDLPVEANDPGKEVALPQRAQLTLRSITPDGKLAVSQPDSFLGLLCCRMQVAIDL